MIPDDIEAEVRERIVILSHLVPSVSWWTVWTLPFYVWAGYAAFVDAWLSDRKR